MKNLIFVSSALQQPRHQKRIDLFRQYFSAKVYYFAREKYKLNIKDYAVDAVRIGRARDGSYSDRVLTLCRLWYLLWRDSTEIVYCTGPDQAVVALLAKKKVYLELGDLYQLDGRGKVFSMLDSILCKKLAGLVLTSPYFLSDYYAKKCPQVTHKTIVVENKLPVSFGQKIANFRASFSGGKKEGEFRLGLIGSFVFRKPLEALAQVLKRRPDISLHAYGDGLTSVFDGIPNFRYYGAFQNPEDLPRIYNSIDASFMLYDVENNNVKLALPNKLYESIAFVCPIICAQDASLGELVQRKGFGVASSIDSIEEALNEMIGNHEKYRQQLLVEPRESYLDMQQDKILSLIGS